MENSFGVDNFLFLLEDVLEEIDFLSVDDTFFKFYALVCVLKTFLIAEFVFLKLF